MWRRSSSSRIGPRHCSVILPSLLTKTISGIEKPPRAGYSASSASLTATKSAPKSDSTPLRVITSADSPRFTAIITIRSPNSSRIALSLGNSSLQNGHQLAHSAITAGLPAIISASARDPPASFCTATDGRDRKEGALTGLLATSKKEKNPARQRSMLPTITMTTPIGIHRLRPCAGPYLYIIKDPKAL